MTAIFRELTYPQHELSWLSPWIKSPPTGIILLLSVYLAFVIGLEYHGNSISGAQHFQALSLRAAWLTVAQLPLLILLAGKNNLIGVMSGISYERLNVLHRWVARMIWLTATLHWGYQEYGWSQYGLTSMERATDICYPTGGAIILLSQIMCRCLLSAGIAAWTIITWINFSSIAPLRNWKYEAFVIQHIILFVGFIIAIMIHIPVTYPRVYVYIPISLYVFDRLVRSLRFTCVNSRLCRATISALPGNVSKIRVQSSRLRSWKPGQHIFLSIPRFGLLQSHPATIMSTPLSHNGDLIFVLKAHKGFTRRLCKSATSSTTSLLPPNKEKSDAESGISTHQTHRALLSGPYGASQSDLAAFSSTLLIAGSTGVTFILPILLDIAQRAKSTHLPLRQLSFIWIIKSSTWIEWIADDFYNPVASLKAAGIAFDINIYVTCDEEMTDANTTSPSTGRTVTISDQSSGCKCTNTEGPCCCTVDISPIPSPTDCKSALPNPTTCLSTRPSGPYTLHSGRPALEDLIWGLLDKAEGESGIAVCGPLGLGARCRRAVAGISDARGVHKGSGAEGVYLHVENYGW